MKFRIPTEEDEEINIMPLIDVVLMLLIFLMMSSHMKTIEMVPISLPVANNGKVPEEALDRQIITASIDQDGSVSYFTELRKMDIMELTTEITRQREANENLKVYLRADRLVQYKNIEAVMDACAQAGISDIIFGVVESGSL